MTKINELLKTINGKPSRFRLDAYGWKSGWADINNSLKSDIGCFDAFYADQKNITKLAFIISENKYDEDNHNIEALKYLVEYEGIYIIDIYEKYGKIIALVSENPFDGKLDLTYSKEYKCRNCKKYPECYSCDIKPKLPSWIKKLCEENKKKIIEARKDYVSKLSNLFGKEIKLESEEDILNSILGDSNNIHDGIQALAKTLNIAKRNNIQITESAVKKRLTSLLYI